MATTLLTDSLPVVSDAPQIDVPNFISPVIEADVQDIGLRSQSADTAITHPILSDIVRAEERTYEERVAATRRFEDDMATKITESAVDSKNKDGALRKLDQDLAIANSELLKSRQSEKILEAFPTIEERGAFGIAALKGGNNPDAYDDPKHKQYITDLNETSKNLLGGLNRSWTGEATTPGGYKVAGYTVKPMSNGDAVVNLRMQGQEPNESAVTTDDATFSSSAPSRTTEDKGWDSFSKSIKIKLPTVEDVDTELVKANSRLSEIQKELPAARQRVKMFEGVMSNVDEGAGALALSEAASNLALSSLEAESRQLQQRRDSLTKDGKRVLANERVADTIRTTPELLKQVRDKGVGERLANATDSLLMSMNVVGEELGLPQQQGARKTAAEATAMIGESGRGMEQAEFSGTLADQIGIATVENLPLLAMQAGASGAGIIASLGPMAVSSYGSNLVSAEQQAQGAEDRGDTDGAKKIRDNARAYAGLMSAVEVGTELMFPVAGAPLSKAARGMTAFNRLVKAPIKEGVEEVVAGTIQSQFAPMIGNYESPFSSDRIVEFGAGFLGAQIQQLPAMAINQAPTKREQVEVLRDVMKQLQADAGVNAMDATPIDITARAVPVTEADGSQGSADNPFAFHQPEGSQNWVMMNEALRERAVAAGVKVDFPTEQGAQQFAQTMHQSIAEAELRSAASQAGIPQDQTDSSITLISSALKQAAIAEGQRTDNLWARYQFQFMPEMTREAAPEATPEPPLPPAGTEVSPSPSDLMPENLPIEQREAWLVKRRENAIKQASDFKTGDRLMIDDEEWTITLANGGQIDLRRNSDGKQAFHKRDDLALGLIADRNGDIQVKLLAPEPEATVTPPSETPSTTAPSWIQETEDAAVASMSAEQIETIKRMAANRATAREIAAALGVETTDVIAVRSKLGIPPWTMGTNMSGADVVSPEFTAWRESYLKEQAASAPPPLETKLQEGRAAVNKKQAAPKAAATPSPTKPGTKLKARIEGAIEEVEYITNNNDGSHRVMTSKGETSVRSGNLSENNGGTLFQSITPQKDSEYMAAVESGDTAKQQAMVDEAAKAAGYTVGPVYHGTTRKKVSIISPSKGVEVPDAAFFTDNEDMAEEYTMPREYGETVYEDEDGNEIEPGIVVGVMLRLNNPMVVDMDGDVGDTIVMSKAVREAKKNGNDGVIFENVRDGMADSDNEGTSYAIFDSNQAKSRDPITNDKGGNPIPLSQRFNPESNSILFQSGQEQGSTIKGKIDTPLGPLHHALISLTSTSDVSTIMHEFIHGLALLETPVAEGKTRSILQSVLGNKAKAFYAWASEGTENLSPGDAYVRMHERIAEGFEKWLTDGSLPEHKNQGMLRKAFEAIKVAMRGIVSDMLGKGFNYQFLDAGDVLPANVQEAYQQLFALLDTDTRQRESISLSPLQQIGANYQEALDALYPLTRMVAGQRVPFTPSELADIAAQTGDSIEELSKQANDSVVKANSPPLFQSVGEGLPADKAKYLIDSGTAAMVNALAKNAGNIPTFEEWIGDIRATQNQAFAGLGEPAMQTIYYASTLNIPATQALSVQQQVDAVILAVGESVSPEGKAAFSDAINAVLPSMQPAMAKRLSVAAKAVADADTAKKQGRAMKAAMKIVRADAKSKFATTSQKLYNLLKGYRIGTGNANQVRDIIDEVNAVIKPLLKSNQIGKSTKKLVEDTLTLMGYSARGDVDMQDVVNLMLHNIGLVQSDLAQHAETNFLRGARAGGKYGAAQFKARQDAIIGVIIDNLKTVTGLSPTQTERAIKLIRGASTDKQLNKATWKALLLFQDQRVRDAYDHVGQLQEAIKANIKRGKFGDLSDWVGQFNSFEPHTIPQHMLAQYLSLAEPVSSKEPVILLNGMKNQIESMNRQLDQWLEANPEEEQTRPSTLSNGFEEAMERLDILDQLESAKRTRQREKFVTKQQEFGKTKDMAEEAARAISQLRAFETFEEADEDELTAFASNRQLRGILNSFANYNEGIVTPFIIQKAQELKAQRFQKLFLPQLTYGVRHFLRLSGDAKIDADDAELRSDNILKRILGWVAGYRTLTNAPQAKGAKTWIGGSIEGQFRDTGIHNFDSLLNTANWINENVVQPISKSQITGLLERDRILTLKDEHGMSIKDYELALDDPTNYNESLLRAMQPELDMGLWSNIGITGLPRGVAEKVTNIKYARREMMSHIMGMAMHQRQRERNGMEGNYIDYILGGAFKRKGTEFVENEFKRQQAAARVIKKMLGTQKVTAENISAFLPQTAKRAMAHTDSLFDRTGQWTYFLNMIENESLLPMPEAYFPIMSMEENTTIEQRVKNLTGIPLGAIGTTITPRTAPRASSRHARLNENLKLANADFFGVVNDAIHQAAADSAMTPFLKVMDRGMNGIQRLKGESERPIFGGVADQVVVEMHKALIEHGARMSHVILADPGVATKWSSYIASIFPKMVLDKVQRPLVEGVGNLGTILTFGNLSQFASGLNAVWRGGDNEEWGRLMLTLKAPTVLRNGSESTTGPMQDLAAALTTAFDSDAHAPTWIENLIAEVKNKKPQRQGLLQRSQSHILARLTSAIRHLMVTAGEQMWIRPYWAGNFMDSMKTQTGEEFDMAAFKAGAYTTEQLDKAVANAELEIARIMSPSARGAGRLVSQQTLNEQKEIPAMINSMVWAMTNFIGAQSNTGKFAMKALIEGRSGNIDRRAKGAQQVAALVAGNIAVSVASSFFVMAMRALVDKLRLDDDEEKSSVAIHQFNEWLSNANPMNIKSAGAFWSKMALRSLFSLRFGGLNTLARFLVGTGTELAWWGAGTVAGGFKSGYDPFKDNLTYEAEPGVTAALGYKLGISDDPSLMRAFQNTNVFTATRMMGSLNAVANLAGTVMNDVSGIRRMMGGEGDGTGAALNLAANVGLLLSSTPFYATIADSTGQMAKLESPWFKTYTDSALTRIAERAGREYATTGDVKWKDQIEGMPKQYQKEAAAEITKIKYFERASTVPSNPEATKLISESLNSIRNAPESTRHEKMAVQFRSMEEAGLKKEFLRGVRMLRQPEAKYGARFGSQGASSDFANKLKAFEKERYGKISAWSALYGG